MSEESVNWADEMRRVLEELILDHESGPVCCDIYNKARAAISRSDESKKGALQNLQSVVLTPYVHCNEFHAGTIKEAKGYLHESREGVGYVRLLVTGPGEVCWRCGCGKSGWSNMRNVVRTECPSPSCPCHTEERCQ